MTKSKLLEVIVKKRDSPLQHPRESQPPKDTAGAFIIDFMPIIRTMTEIPETYEKLTWKFLRMLPLGYNRIDMFVIPIKSVR